MFNVCIYIDSLVNIIYQRELVIVNIMFNVCIYIDSLVNIIYQRKLVIVKYYSSKRISDSLINIIDQR